MDKILTIVIPSYNAEATLKQTVDSMLIPDIELRQQLDILIVNDGSKDRTLALARKLEADNLGVVHVWDQENSGHKYTVNVGVNKTHVKLSK